MASFRNGNIVLHASLGRGVVQRVDTAKGMVKVRFPRRLPSGRKYDDIHWVAIEGLKRTTRLYERSAVKPKPKAKPKTVHHFELVV